MSKFNVHIYTQVRVKVAGIEAQTMAEAMEKAESSVDLHALCDNKALQVSLYDLGGGMKVEAVEWAEGAPDYFLVDPLKSDGEVDYEAVKTFGPDGLQLIDCKTTQERNAQACVDAIEFMEEMQDLDVSLPQIADLLGNKTLSDLMTVQQAILKYTWVEHITGESHLLSVINRMKSAKRWLTYIQIVENSTQETFTIKLIMENGQEYLWSGQADDKEHAEGLAIAEATSKTGEQVKESTVHQQ